MKVYVRVPITFPVLIYSGISILTYKSNLQEVSLSDMRGTTGFWSQHTHQEYTVQDRFKISTYRFQFIKYQELNSSRQ